MKVAVRYYSRSGNTKKVADVIAETAGVKAVSADAKNAGISEPVDLLFIGGALYAYGLDKHLSAYLDTLSSDKVKRAALFSTSWLSKHALTLMKEKLEAKGIKVEEKTCYLKSKQVDGSTEAIRRFARAYL